LIKVDERLRQKLMESKACGACVEDLAENLARLCERRNLGEPCKESSIEAVISFIEEKENTDQFVQRLKKIFGEDYELGVTENEKEGA
jgi:hypothetical protein